MKESRAAKRRRLEQALTSDENDARAWHDLGAAGGGKVKGVEHTEQACYLRALTADEKYAPAWLDFGLAGGGEVNGVEHEPQECCIRALTLDENFALAWHNLGSMFGGGVVNGVEHTAQACEVRGLTLDEKYAPGWHGLGFAGGGKVNGVEYTPHACYIKALTIDEKYSPSWHNLGATEGGAVKGRLYTAEECALLASRPHKLRELGTRQLRVCIVGGGPAGLAAAIGLCELATESGRSALTQVEVLDSRYHESEGGHVTYAGAQRASGAASRRRGQVVTLQEDCLNLLSRETRQVLLRDVNEQVWPASYNIPIREVEDRLLERAQSPEFHSMLQVRKGSASDTLQRMADFDVLVGADGSKSQIREALFGGAGLRTEGRDVALGVAFNIPEGEFPAGLPLPQPWNVIRTVVQRRFQLSASSVTRSGFLYIQLTEDEFKLAVRADGSKCVFGCSPGFVRSSPGGPLPEGAQTTEQFQPQVDGHDGKQGGSADLWGTVLVGLAMFGLAERHVASIIGIELDVRYSDKVLQQKDACVAVLLGDAAFSTYVWPGRSVNSVLKEAALLSACLHSVGKLVASDGSAPVRTGLAELSEYEKSVAELRLAEHRERSLRCTCGTTNNPRDAVDEMQEHARSALAALNSQEQLAAAARHFHEAVGSRRPLWDQLPRGGHADDAAFVDLQREAAAFFQSLADGDFGDVGKRELLLMKEAGPGPPAGPEREVLPDKVIADVQDLRRTG